MAEIIGSGTAPMSDPSMTGDLVERLRHTAAQLRHMQQLASFAGQETGVRVKDPSLLLADLDEAASLITKQAAEIENAWQEFGNVPRDCSLAEHTKAALDELAGIAEDERRRAETAEARIAVLEAALTEIATELQSSIDTHEFNSRHMIAEDSLQDAWKMLDMAREQFQVDANSLRIPLSRARNALVTP